jgi:hypothetical protein
MGPIRVSAKRPTSATHHNDPDAPPLKKPTPQPSPSSRPPNSTSTAAATAEPKPGQSNPNPLASRRTSDTVPLEGTTATYKNGPHISIPNDKNPKMARRSYPPSLGRKPSSTPVSPTFPKVPTAETSEKLDESLQKLSQSTPKVPSAEKDLAAVANEDPTSPTQARTARTAAAKENQMAESITVLRYSKECPPSTKPPCRVVRIKLRPPISRETLRTYNEPECPTRHANEITKVPTPPSPEQGTLSTPTQPPNPLSPPESYLFYQWAKRAKAGPTIQMPQYMPSLHPTSINTDLLCSSYFQLSTLCASQQSPKILFPSLLQHHL